VNALPRRDCGTPSSARRRRADLNHNEVFAIFTAGIDPECTLCASSARTATRVTVGECAREIVLAIGVRVKVDLTR